MSKEKDKLKSNDGVAKLLNKKFGKNIIQTASLMSRIEIGRISTGSISMDIETGGGFPKGRLTEIYGLESSGKTYVCLKAAVQAQKEGKVLWIDAEGVFDPKWASLIGINLDNLEIAKPETAEQVGTILDSATRSEEYSLIVLDSVAACLPEEDLDKAMDDRERIGNRAMIMNRIVRKVQSGLNIYNEETSHHNETCVIFINQIRFKIGVMYGNPEDTPGGMGIRFHSSLRINMRRGDLIKIKPVEGDTGASPDGKLIVGVTIKFKTSKNKTYTPLKTGQFILNTHGENKAQIDRVDEIFRYGILSGIIKQKGPSTTYGEKKFLGKEACLSWLRENPEEIEKTFIEIRKIYG